jgi:hypothetical protein
VAAFASLVHDYSKYFLINVKREVTRWAAVVGELNSLLNT